MTIDADAVESEGEDGDEHDLAAPGDLEVAPQDHAADEKRVEDAGQVIHRRIAHPPEITAVKAVGAEQRDPDRHSRQEPGDLIAEPVGPREVRGKQRTEQQRRDVCDREHPPQVVIPRPVACRDTRVVRRNEQQFRG